MSERLKPTIKIVIPLLFANLVFVLIDYYLGYYVDFVYELVIPANSSVAVATHVNLPENFAFLNPLVPEKIAIVPVLKYMTLFPLFFIVFRLIINKVWK